MKPLLLLIGLVLATSIQAQDVFNPTVETESQVRARAVSLAPRDTRDALLNKLEYANSLIWDAPDPAAVLAELGTSGRKLFEVNTSFATLVASFLTAEGDSVGLARLAAMQAKIKPCTIHPDGTITINPE